MLIDKDLEKTGAVEHLLLMRLIRVPSYGGEDDKAADIPEGWMKRYGIET